jgi:hypothetical protein
LEISQIEKSYETSANLESRLLWGTYPEAVILADNRRREEFLRELMSSYLLKDILELEGVRHSSKLVQLLQLLAFQIGKEASLSEILIRWRCATMSANSGKIISSPNA